MNNVEPFAYLKGTPAGIAAGHPASKTLELPPWVSGQSRALFHF